MTDPYFLEVSIVLTSGDAHRLASGDLDLVLWLRASEVGSSAQGRGVVCEHREGGSHRVVAVERTAARVLVEQLRALGFPGRPARVEAKVDSSDRWAHLLLHVSLDDKRDSVDLSMFSSGYEGPDAVPLRAFLSKLAAIAGVTSPRAFFDLTGDWPAQRVS